MLGQAIGANENQFVTPNEQIEISFSLCLRFITARVSTNWGLDELRVSNLGENSRREQNRRAMELRRAQSETEPFVRLEMPNGASWFLYGWTYRRISQITCQLTPIERRGTTTTWTVRAVNVMCCLFLFLVDWIIVKQCHEYERVSRGTKVFKNFAVYLDFSVKFSFHSTDATVLVSRWTNLSLARSINFVSNWMWIDTVGRESSEVKLSLKTHGSQAVQLAEPFVQKLFRVCLVVAVLAFLLVALHDVRRP